MKTRQSYHVPSFVTGSSSVCLYRRRRASSGKQSDVSHGLCRFLIRYHSQIMLGGLGILAKSVSAQDPLSHSAKSKSPRNSPNDAFSYLRGKAMGVAVSTVRFTTT
jgi:hypothetical protein